jgi:hypothetical protein
VVTPPWTHIGHLSRASFGRSAILPSADWDTALFYLLWQ